MEPKMYIGPIVNVSFDATLCQHAAECIRGMPTVFDVRKRPWVDPGNASTEEEADRLREVVGRCPSGALRIHERER